MVVAAAARGGGGRRALPGLVSTQPVVWLQPAGAAQDKGVVWAASPCGGRLPGSGPASAFEPGQAAHCSASHRSCPAVRAKGSAPAAQLELATVHLPLAASVVQPGSDPALGKADRWRHHGDWLWPCLCPWNGEGQMPDGLLYPGQADFSCSPRWERGGESKSLCCSIRLGAMPAHV